MKKAPLIVKRSQLPRSGMGLFTGKAIPKGGVIVEYAGKRRKWNKVKHQDGSNGYFLELNKTIVIDARPLNSGKGRFANDATGKTKVPGLKTNAEYIIRDGKAYIEAMRRINAGEEIFVEYGDDYWGR